MPGTKTQPGPLRTLLDRPLVRINADAVTLWVTTETKTLPARKVDLLLRVHLKV